ncbi:MAG: hypothetical protein H6807_09885 [Planctomycetes bacterium]|nr:hypothetical protein [Planctomycetota bacterium]
MTSRTAGHGARKALRILLGASFWALVGLLLVRGFRDQGLLAETSRRLRSHALAEPPRFTARFPAGSPLAPGNPLRIRVENGFFAAGRIEEVGAPENGLVPVVVSIFPEYADRLGPDTRLIAARTSGDISWVVQTLLPDSRRDYIQAQLRGRWHDEKDDLLQLLKPGLKRLSADSFELLRRRLPLVVAAHRAEVDQIMEVLRERGWHGELEEVFNQVVWPLVEQRSLGLLEAIGNELVEELPVWSMSWSYVVQSMPFGSKDRLEKRLRAFLQEDAVPIVKKHGPEFEAMAREVLNETSHDERTRAATGRALTAISEDPRFNQALERLLEALVVEDQEVRAFGATIWQRADLREPLEDFLGRFEPEIKRIANSLLLDESRRGINPDLARVLRRKLLREDEDWVLLDPGAAGPGPVPAVLPGENGGIR